MAHVTLERHFDPPITDELLEQITGRLAPCLDRNGIEWIRSHLSLDRTRLLCFFEAPDAGALRGALVQAKIDYEAVWSGTVLTP